MAGQIDASKLPAVWPNNINRLKTIQKGRRISKEQCCDNPIVQEMGEVCQFLKLTHVLEPYKVIPRDNTAYPGRIRVKIFDDDGNPVNEDIKCRMDLMRKMGEMVPKLTIRCDLGVPSCGGAFTSFKRVVSRRGGRGWFLFRFWGCSDRVERPRCSAQGETDQARTGPPRAVQGPVRGLRREEDREGRRASQEEGGPEEGTGEVIY